LNQLKTLGELKKDGILGEDEFNEQKQVIVRDLTELS
jgi:hypothetical protein